MASQVELIKKLVEELIKAGKSGTTGEAALTPFLNLIGLSNYSALKTKFVDTMSGYSTTQNFLEQGCGVRVNNTDTGAITGSDAGGSTTKTAESIIPESTTAVELTDEEYNSFTKNGLTFNITYSTPSYGVDSAFNYDKDVYLTKQRLVVRALYNWWIPESLDLIKESLGIDFNNSTLKTINVNFTSSHNMNINTPLNVNVNSDMGTASNATFTIGMYYLSSITESDLNGTLSGLSSYFNYKICLPEDSGGDISGYYMNWKTSYFDRVLLMGLTEVALRANIPYFYELPSEIQDGLRKLVNGFDDGSVSASTRDGYVLLRYLAKQYADALSTGLEYNDDKTAVTVTADYDQSTLTADTYESTVVTITGASRSTALNITGNSKNNVIIGTKGADTLNGAEGSDTLTGGSGKDIFIYTAGNDVITDYTAGQDTISISGSLSSGKVSGSDVILNIGSDSLTLKKAAGKKLTIKTNDQTLTTVYGGADDATILTVTNSTKSPVTVGNSIKTIDASKRTSAVKITGNSSANSIKGGSGADTLVGGKGNDTLTGGSGKDVFLYANGDGNDVITDYTAGQDSIKITSGSISKATTSGSNVVLTVGSGKITVKNAKAKNLTLIDSSGKTSTTVIGGSSSSTTSGGTASLSSGMSYTNSNKTLKVDSPFTGTVDVSKYDSKVTTIDASSNKKFVTIKGTSCNETIKAGTHGSSLIGGKGDDTLYGGKGADVFTYSNGDGKDVINNFSPDYDTINIKSGTISKASISGSDVVLTVGSGSITIKNAKSKDINITTSNGETKTYNFTSTVTNPTKSYEERNYWFEDNAECRMQNDELESILVETNDLTVDDLNFNDQINSQENITSLTYSQQKKK